MIALGAGLVFVGAGIWAFAAPRSFFECAALFEPYNAHLAAHVIDRNVGGDPAVDMPAFGILAVALILAAVARGRSLGR